MKSLLPLLLTIVLQSVFTALAVVFHWDTLRPEPAIAIMAFAAVRLDPVAGVVAASAIGFGTDLMASSPLGLHMLAYTLTYLAARMLADFMGLSRTISALPFTFGLSILARATVLLLLVLFADADGRMHTWTSIFPSALVDMLSVLPIWLLLEFLYRRVDPEAERNWRRA